MYLVCAIDVKKHSCCMVVKHVGIYRRVVCLRALMKTRASRYLLNIYSDIKLK